MLRYINETILVAMPLLLAFCGTANAGIVVDIFTVGADVHISLSGDINTDALGPDYGTYAFEYPVQISPSTGEVILGSQGNFYEVYTPGHTLTPFGLSSPIYPTSYLGDIAGIFGAGVYLPQGYITVQPLTGTAVFADTTINNFGSTGSYVTTFSNNGTSDTFTINVYGGASVPEPSTAIAMGLLGIVGFAGNRRRRRQVSVA
jgi:hypothetical protein